MSIEVPPECGTFGNPSAPLKNGSTIRLYSKEECDKLGGEYDESVKECLKPEGGSFSFDCRGLNMMGGEINQMPKNNKNTRNNNSKNGKNGKNAQIQMPPPPPPPPMNSNMMSPKMMPMLAPMPMPVAAPMLMPSGMNSGMMMPSNMMSPKMMNSGMMMPSGMNSGMNMGAQQKKNQNIRKRRLRMNPSSMPMPMPMPSGMNSGMMPMQTINSGMMMSPKMMPMQTMNSGMMMSPSPMFPSPMILPSPSPMFPSPMILPSRKMVPSMNMGAQQKKNQNIRNAAKGISEIIDLAQGKVMQLKYALNAASSSMSAENTPSLSPTMIPKIGGRRKSHYTKKTKKAKKAKGTKKTTKSRRNQKVSRKEKRSTK